MLRETDGTAVLEQNESQTKTRIGADPKDSHAVKPKTFAGEGSERDPVRNYDLYASKRPDDLKTLDSLFHTTKAIKTKPWLKSAPMGVNQVIYENNSRKSWQQPLTLF